MIDQKNTIETVSLEQWKQKLLKDLKVETLTSLEFVDEIENLNFQAYQHQDTTEVISTFPSNFPFTRNWDKVDNDWKNAQVIHVYNENKANEKSLQLLNQGITALQFSFEKDEINCPVLFDQIEFQHIHTTFIINSISQFNTLKSFIGNFDQSIFSFEVDLLKFPKLIDEIGYFSTFLKESQVSFFIADGYQLQASGANSIQEIAYQLSSANEVMLLLVEHGLTSDEAAACIHFKVGIGSNFIQQIAKIRSLRTLWSFIVKQYQPEHACSFYAKINATIGLLNKSAKDPHTNLLRQTTEAMSALIAGVDSITVIPHDANSKKEISMLSERMAINIPLILKEESYFDKVIDVAGGSYAIENMTKQMTQKSWALFQEIDSKGGIFAHDAQNLMSNLIKQSIGQRIQNIKDKKQTLIGINKFPNPENIDNSYQSQKTVLGFNTLFLENEI